MRNEITVLPVLWSRKDKEGLFPIKIRITKNRKSTYVSVGYSVKKSDWSEFKRKVKTINLYHLMINEKIDELISEIESTNPKIEFQPKLKISYVAVLLQLCLQQQEYDSSFWQLMLVAVPCFCLCLASSQRHVFLQQ